MSDYCSKIQSAYEAGDLNDEVMLKRAMMFENFSHCSDNIKDKLTSSDDWSGLQADVLKPDAERCFSHLKGLGDECKNNAPIIRIIPTRSILRIGGSTKNILQNIKNTDNSIERVSKFNSALWSQWCKKTLLKKRFCWLYMEKKIHSADTIDLLQNLGLFSLYERSEADTFFQMTFKPVQCLKPNWIDAGFTFYFCESKRSSEHGFTRSLLTGDECYPELVHKDVAALELTDVNVLTLEKTHHFGMLSEMYRSRQSNRIDSCRKGKV